MSEVTFIRFCYFLKYLIDPESNGVWKKLKLPKFVKDTSNLASFYDSHIHGIVFVIQIGLGSARTLKEY